MTQTYINSKYKAKKLFKVLALVLYFFYSEKFISAQENLDNLKLQNFGIAIDAPATSDAQNTTLDTFKNIDLNEYKSAESDFTLSENRELKNWQWQITVDDLVVGLYGFETSYFLNSYLALGLKFNSLHIAQFLFNKDKNYNMLLKVKKISVDDIDVGLETSTAFEQLGVFIRFFPFKNSGFFLQLGYLYGLWSIDNSLVVKNQDTKAIGISDGKLAKVKITPINDIDTRLGFNLVSQFGFSHTIGIGYINHSAPNFDYSVAKTNLNEDVLDADEIKAANDVIKKRISVLKNRVFLFLGVGHNF